MHAPKCFLHWPTASSMTFCDMLPNCVNGTVLQVAGGVAESCLVPTSIPKFRSQLGLGLDWRPQTWRDKIQCFLLKELDCFTSVVSKSTALLNTHTCCQQFDAWLAASASSAELHSSSYIPSTFNSASTKNNSLQPSCETTTETISDLGNVGRQCWMRSVQRGVRVIFVSTFNNK